MAWSWRRVMGVAGAALAAIVMLGAGWALWACAFGPWAPTYTPVNHLDVPEAEFAAGHLGIVHPDASLRDRVVAWRYLSGLPLTAAEQQSFDAQPIMDSWGPTPPSGAHAGDDSMHAWGEMSGQRLGLSYGDDNHAVWSPGVYRSVSGAYQFDTFLNCPMDAFRAAVATLRDRRARYGEGSPRVRAWLDAQKSVFTNCDGKQAVEIPRALPATAPEIARADRAYQIAAAQFYAMEYRTAAARFEAIADDAGSPWRTSGGYLAARAMVREATVQPLEQSAPSPGYHMPVMGPVYERVWLTKAEKEIDTVLANQADSSWWGPARELRGYIELRLHPEQQALVLAHQLERPNDATFGQNTIDLEYAGQRANLAGEQDPLLRWTARSPYSTKPSGASALEEWRKTHRLTWLVAALARLVPGEPPNGGAASLLSAARGLPERSPAYDTARYGLLRLQERQGVEGPAEVQRDLAALPLTAMPNVTRNQFLTLDLATAPTLAKALAAAPRTSMDGEFTGFDADATAMFNDAMPVALLAKAAESSSAMPERLQRQLLVAAWTRAVATEDFETAESLSPRLAQAAPQLAPDLAKFEAAPALPHGGFGWSPRRSFEAAWLLLHFPGMTPYVQDRLHGDMAMPLAAFDDDGNNWWLPMQLDRGGFLNIPTPVIPSGYAPPPFITGAEIYQWYWQTQQLRRDGAAVNLLCKLVVDASGSSMARDPRMPEALALAVAATSRAPGDTLTGSLSKQAYDVLQTKYPDSIWSQKTPRWFTGYCGRYMECQK